MAKVTHCPPAPTVGVIGAGQLARMMAEAASELNLGLSVLAARPGEPGAPLGARAVVGAPSDPVALREFARTVDVLTLDHELVDLDLLAALARDGTVVRPSPDAVRFAARKDHQRAVMARRGVPVPAHVVLTTAAGARVTSALDGFATPPVVKSAVGGYDGRGVTVPETFDAAAQAVREYLARGPVVLEERVAIQAEVAVQLVTDPSGARRRWPLVRTVQRAGVCVEVDYPAGLSEAVAAEATRVADAVADVVGAVGVLAVELFVTESGVLLNEVATRPHNSGHWTIEGAVTSQFENHLRAVAGLPLGSTEPVAAAAVMVNVVGTTRPWDLAAALAVEGAHVHDYSKEHRPGRKLGHVTVTGPDRESARVRAWSAARALGAENGEEQS